MGQPYSRALRAALTAGQYNCVTLPLPPRGFIRRLVVHQVSGVVAGFDFEIFDRIEACSADSQSDQTEACSNPNHPLLSPAAHKVFNDVVVATGINDYSNFDLNLPYQNHDLQCDGPPTNALYMRIKPNGTGTKNFDIAVSTESPTFL